MPENLDRTVIAIPLFKILKAERERLAEAHGHESPIPPVPHRVIIDLNLEFPGGREKARQWVVATVDAMFAAEPAGQAAKQSWVRDKGNATQQYLFAALTGAMIQELVRRDHDYGDQRKRELVDIKKAKTVAQAIYHIWPDFRIRGLTNRSISTVKADAAHASFSAFGKDIVWAVLDSGIDRKHPHFKKHQNLELQPPLAHMDFTGGHQVDRDPFGHGTHVAGIIAGEAIPRRGGIRAFGKQRDERGNVTFRRLEVERMSGMAPRCKLVNMRVLDDDGDGEVSNIIAAVNQIQEINGYGRRLLIHGANLSVGHNFEPEWFACGQSPLCVEVNRLVNSGVVVVVAAGNSGYGSLETSSTGTITAGMSLTINDPGNADDAITVGSTHREMPHVYGVSYFSSKGPTGDGRAKPDMVAPGEKIVSCAAGAVRTRMKSSAGDCDYCEDSGTSMAAPHVAGVIAAFLSVRREFIGRTAEVKKIFTSTATDLNREKYFQGAGLVDLMRAIQSV